MTESKLTTVEELLEKTKTGKELMEDEIVRYWVETLGSNRLREQIRQGYSGWPLFLHEKLEHDFPWSEFGSVMPFRDGHTKHKPIPNPSAKMLQFANEIAKKCVRLDLIPEESAIFPDLWIYRIDVQQFPSGEETDEYGPRLVVMYSDYRPTVKHKSFTILFYNNKYDTGDQF